MICSFTLHVSLKVLIIVLVLRAASEQILLLSGDAVSLCNVLRGDSVNINK